MRFHPQSRSEEKASGFMTLKEYGMMVEFIANITVQCAVFRFLKVDVISALIAEQR